MEPTADVLIIGGGVIGLACAMRLAEAGQKVCVLEKDVCGAGASTAAFGALMPYNPSADVPVAKDQWRSLWMYEDFARDVYEHSGIETGFRRCGRIQPITSEQQRSKMQVDAALAQDMWPRFQGHPAQEVLSQTDALKREPECDIGPYGALHCRASARVDTAALVAGLRAACLKLRVALYEGAKVDALEPELHEAGHRICSSAGVFWARNVVVANGAWAGQLLDVPVTPLKGQVVELQADKPLVHHMVRGRGVYVLQGKSNRILVGATKEDAGFDTTIDQDAIDRLMVKGEALVPALAEAKFSRAWAGLRPACASGAPLVGPVDSMKGVYMAVGHGGIGHCLAPLTAQKVVSLVVGAPSLGE